MAMSDEELFVGDENDSNSKVPAHESDPHDATMQQQGEVLPNPPSNNASEASSSGTFLTNNNSNLNVAGSSSISSSSPGQSGTNVIPQKRLFSPNNSACTGVTHRPSVDLSACGSEFARSSDDAIRHGEVFIKNYGCTRKPKVQ
uniref:Uncharacterized protein n=1 Tax=Wuchereria bancrofti TaxID=6293 RepID=A0A1I8ES59_WUCBA